MACLTRILLKMTFSFQESKNIMHSRNRFDRFRNEMTNEDRVAFDDLLQKTDRHSSISYLATRQYPFEQLLLTMMIEVHKEAEKLKDEVRWKLMA